MRNTTKINLLVLTSAAIHPPAKARGFLAKSARKMERTRKEYLVLKSDQAGEADILGVFSSRRKAKAASGTDNEENNAHSYWIVVLPEDRPVRMGKNESDMTKQEPLQDRK